MRRISLFFPRLSPTRTRVLVACLYPLPLSILCFLPYPLPLPTILPLCSAAAYPLYPSLTSLPPHPAAAEFDRVHYPLPLLYEDAPDPWHLRQVWNAQNVWNRT